VCSHVLDYWCSISGKVDGISLFAASSVTTVEVSQSCILRTLEAIFPCVKLSGRTSNILRISDRNMDVVILYHDYLRSTPASSDSGSTVNYNTASSWLSPGELLCLGMWHLLHYTASHLRSPRHVSSRAHTLSTQYMLLFSSLIWFCVTSIAKWYSLEKLTTKKLPKQQSSHQYPSLELENAWMFATTPLCTYMNIRRQHRAGFAHVLLGCTVFEESWHLLRQLPILVNYLVRGDFTIIYTVGYVQLWFLWSHIFLRILNIHCNYKWSYYMQTNRYMESDTAKMMDTLEFVPNATITNCLKHGPSTEANRFSWPQTTFMEPEGISPCSQEPTIGSCPDPNESSPHPQTAFFKDIF
jgi:hypothetical protein